MGNTQLSERQKRFIDYYIMNGGRGADAARRAGYSEKSATTTAYHLLQRSVIKAAILKRQVVMENEGIADIQEIKSYWTNVMCGKVPETRVDKQGKEYYRKVRVNTRLRAAKALAKFQGVLLKEAEAPQNFNIIWVDMYE